MNINIIGKFYLGNGGIGDCLLFLSTFYDDVEEANVVFLANDIASITELLKLFPKIKKKLVLKNDFTLLRELYSHQNCIGTGILPRNLDYSTWYKVDVFKEYGVKEFPKFVDLFSPIRLIDNPEVKQAFIQTSGSNIEGQEKQRILTEKTYKSIRNEFPKYQFCSADLVPKSTNTKVLSEVFSLIHGSDIVIGVDSFSKTFGAMCGIKTICYDNIYSPAYLQKFRDGIDYGHYVFIFPYSKIEFRFQ